MSISSHLEEFYGRPVREFDPTTGLVDDPAAAWRIGFDWQTREGVVSFATLLDRFLEAPVSPHVKGLAAPRVEALVIGVWEPEGMAGSSSAEAVQALAGAKDRLPALKALFLGDITYEECEISWLNQSDVAPILAAYPALEQFGVRGGNSLEIYTKRHESLRTLVIEAGGLSGSVVRSVGKMELPNLEDLELWLGTAEYGGDTSDEDLAEILSGENLPKLRRLALRDSDQADRVAALVAESDILKRIEELDLSMGTLGDEGALALIASPALSHLKKLNISHHYVSDEVLDGLIAKGIEVDASDRQDPDDNDGERYVAVAE